MTTANRQFDKAEKSAILVLNEKEESLIRLLRGVPYGTVTIFIDNSTPVRVEKVRESIKL